MDKPHTFWRTTYTVVVLSKDTPASNLGLEELAEAITTGDCSGVSDDDGGKELTRKEMVRALIAQGSDPEFLQLDADGNDLDTFDDGDDEEENTPEEEDGFIFGNAEASFAGKHLGSFEDEDAAERAIRAAGNEGAGFFPNVWRVSDHGNHHLIRDFWSQKDA